MLKMAVRKSPMASLAWYSMLTSYLPLATSDAALATAAMGLTRDLTSTQVKPTPTTRPRAMRISVLVSMTLSLPCMIWLSVSPVATVTFRAARVYTYVVLCSPL